jgi:hypothetical protein
MNTAVTPYANGQDDESEQTTSEQVVGSSTPLQVAQSLAPAIHPTTWPGAQTAET